LDERHEEILEAVWAGSESGISTVEAVHCRCKTIFSDEDFSHLEDQRKLVRHGNELFLTEEGKQKARTLIRCHRLAESLLYTVFDMDWDQREALACQAEHTLVPELADGICTLLGHPDECPDGKAIPPGVCCVTQKETISRQVIALPELAIGSSGRILFVKPKDHNRLREITDIGLTPGVVITLRQRSPSYRIGYDGTELALDHRVAQDLFVCPIGGNDRAALTTPPHGHHRRRGPLDWLGLRHR